jgi:hypothetical protein
LAGWALSPLANWQLQHAGVEEVHTSFFRTLLVQVAATAPQKTGRLLAVFPNVAELLAVMALRKPILSFIVLYPD